jgi:hypothetical protein
MRSFLRVAASVSILVAGLVAALPAAAQDKPAPVDTLPKKDRRSIRFQKRIGSPTSRNFPRMARQGPPARPGRSMRVPQCRAKWW